MNNVLSLETAHCAGFYSVIIKSWLKYSFDKSNMKVLVLLKICFLTLFRPVLPNIRHGMQCQVLNKLHNGIATAFQRITMDYFFPPLTAVKS